MAFITYITAPLKSLDAYDLQHTVSMLLFTWSQLLQISSSGSNFLLLCIFIVLNLYIPYGVHHALPFLMGVICMHVISPRRCYNCQTLSPHPDESLGTFLWVAYKFPLAIKSCSCWCLISIPPTWQSWYPTCSNINLATLSKPIDSGEGHMTL